MFDGGFDLVYFVLPECVVSKPLHHPPFIEMRHNILDFCFTKDPVNVTLLLSVFAGKA